MALSVPRTETKPHPPPPPSSSSSKESLTTSPFVSVAVEGAGKEGLVAMRFLQAFIWPSCSSFFQFKPDYSYFCQLLVNIFLRHICKQTSPLFGISECFNAKHDQIPTTQFEDLTKSPDVPFYNSLNHPSFIVATTNRFEYQGH